jgi:hypothetical protein
MNLEITITLHDYSTDIRFHNVDLSLLWLVFKSFVQRRSLTVKTLHAPEDTPTRLVQEYRDHLQFVYRWISRLNGDKPHDTPEKNWRDYVAAIVHYPLSPCETGDWFED